MRFKDTTSRDASEIRDIADRRTEPLFDSRATKQLIFFRFKTISRFRQLFLSTGLTAFYYTLMKKTLLLTA